MPVPVEFAGLRGDAADDAGTREFARSTITAVAPAPTMPQNMRSALQCHVSGVSTLNRARRLNCGCCANRSAASQSSWMNPEQPKFHPRTLSGRKCSNPAISPARHSAVAVLVCEWQSRTASQSCSETPASCGSRCARLWQRSRGVTPTASSLLTAVPVSLRSDAESEKP